MVVVDVHESHQLREPVDGNAYISRIVGFSPKRAHDRDDMSAVEAHRRTDLVIGVLRITKAIHWTARRVRIAEAMLAYQVDAGVQTERLKQRCSRLIPIGAHCANERIEITRQHCFVEVPVPLAVCRRREGIRRPQSAHVPHSKYSEWEVCAPFVTCNGVV